MLLALEENILDPKFRLLPEAVLVVRLSCVSVVDNRDSDRGSRIAEDVGVDGV